LPPAIPRVGWLAVEASRRTITETLWSMAEFSESCECDGESTISSYCLLGQLETSAIYRGIIAAADRKASAWALLFISQYPDRNALVHAMMDLAREELQHF
jgi:hypothetical protein